MQNLDKKQQKKNDMSVKWELFGEGNQQEGGRVKDKGGGTTLTEILNIHI